MLLTKINHCHIIVLKVLNVIYHKAVIFFITDRSESIRCCVGSPVCSESGCCRSKSSFGWAGWTGSGSSGDPRCRCPECRGEGSVSRRIDLLFIQFFDNYDLSFSNNHWSKFRANVVWPLNLKLTLLFELTTFKHKSRHQILTSHNFIIAFCS